MPPAAKPAPKRQKRAANPAAQAKRQKRASMSLEEAERLAAQEGLVLVPSSGRAIWQSELQMPTQSGYWRVHMQASGSTFQCTGTVGGRKEVNLGNFSSAVEAALAVARNLGPDGSRKAAARNAMAEAFADRPPMDEGEARRLASAEGLVLAPSSDNKTGFMNVSLMRHGYFHAAISSTQGGVRKSRGLSYHKTVFEAALALARALGPAGCAEAVAEGERVAASRLLREEAKQQAQRKREAARGARDVREAERVAVAAAANIAKKRAKEEQEAEQATAAVAAKEAKASTKAKALADKAAQLEVAKAAKVLSKAAAAATAKHEKLVAKQMKLSVNAARRKEYLKVYQKEWSKKAKARKALEEEKAAAAKLLLILPGM